MPEPRQLRFNPFDFSRDFNDEVRQELYEAGLAGAERAMSEMGMENDEMARDAVDFCMSSDMDRTRERVRRAAANVVDGARGTMEFAVYSRVKTLLEQAERESAGVEKE